VNPNTSPGRRYIDSETYKAARARSAAGGGWSGLKDPVEVLSQDELVAALHLRTYADLAPFDIEGVPYVGELPAASLLPAFVETIIETGKLQVEVAIETSEQPLASAVNDGTPYLEAGFNFGSTPTLEKLPRFGIAYPVTEGVLDQPGQVASLLNRRVEYGIGLGLENELLNGNGFWTGMLASAAETVAKGAGYRADAICNAVGVVQALGYYTRPLQVIIHPTTRAAVYTERDTSQRPISVSEMLDDQVNAWIPSKFMPIGQALVGDVFASTSLYVRGALEAAMSDEYMDFFTRAMIEMTLGFRCFGYVHQPNALCTVTGIA
jgi:hypothetical protein